jgi:hypothetical protein
MHTAQYTIESIEGALQGGGRVELARIHDTLQSALWGEQYNQTRADQTKVTRLKFLVLLLQASVLMKYSKELTIPLCTRYLEAIRPEMPPRKDLIQSTCLAARFSTKSAACKAQEKNGTIKEGLRISRSQV